MVKAQIALPDGTAVKIEGTPEEIAVALERLRKAAAGAQLPLSRAARRARLKTQRVTPTDLLVNLIDGGFFKKPKDLASVKAALEEQGYHYPITTLSPLLLRLVRSRSLRRLKENKRWMYTA